MDIDMFMKRAFSTGVTLVTSVVVVGSFSGCAAPTNVADETVATTSTISDIPKNTISDTSKIDQGNSVVLSETSFGEIGNSRVVVERKPATTTTTTITKAQIGSNSNNATRVVRESTRVTVAPRRVQVQPRPVVARRAAPQSNANANAVYAAAAAAQARVNAREEEWLNYQRKWEQEQNRRRAQANNRVAQYNPPVRAVRTQVAQVRQQQNWRANPAPAQAWADAPAPRQQQYIQIAMAPVIDAGRLSNAAVSRTRTSVMYDGRYIPLGYPNGDVPANIGVCSDVVIRAYRQLGIDLQRLVHEDMTYNFNAYPNLPKWGLSAPDPNIDHRRVHNLKAFFARYGQRLPNSQNPSDYRPGDLVTWSLGGDQEHIGVIVDRYSDADPRRPLVVHHIDARGVKMEDMLFTLPITGHYRYLGGAGTTQLVSM